MVDISLDRLLALGEAELARLTDDVRTTAARIDGAADPRVVMAQLGRNHPTAAALIAETRAMLDGLRQFLIDRAIVTVPPDVRPLVEETPPKANKPPTRPTHRHPDVPRLPANGHPNATAGRCRRSPRGSLVVAPSWPC